MAVSAFFLVALHVHKLNRTFSLKEMYFMTQILGFSLTVMAVISQKRFTSIVNKPM